MHTGARIPQIAGHSTRSLDRFPSRLSVRVIQIRKACKCVFRYFAIHVSAGVTIIAADMIGVSRVQGRDASVVEQETWIRRWLSTGHDTICSHSFNIFHMRNSAASPLCLTAKGNYFQQSYPSQPPENFHPFQSFQLPACNPHPLPVIAKASMPHSKSCAPNRYIPTPRSWTAWTRSRTLAIGFSRIWRRPEKYAMSIPSTIPQKNAGKVIRFTICGTKNSGEEAP